MPIHTLDEIFSKKEPDGLMGARNPMIIPDIVLENLQTTLALEGGVGLLQVVFVPISLKASVVEL